MDKSKNDRNNYITREDLASSKQSFGDIDFVKRALEDRSKFKDVGNFDGYMRREQV